MKAKMIGNKGRYKKERVVVARLKSILQLIARLISGR
jgi:hypothetical protein